MRNLDIRSREDIAAEQVKLDGLTAKLKELEERKRDLEASVVKVRRFDLETAATQVVNGSDYDPGYRRLYDDIEALDKSIAVYERAREVQEKNIRQVKSFASAQICKELQPDYDAILKKVRDACRGLVQAIDLQYAFMDELQRNEIHVGYLDLVILPARKDSLEHFIRSVDDRLSGKAVKG